VKLNDAVWGALLLLLSAALLVHVQSFPKIPGQQVGPALFPGIVAVALGVCAVLLVFKGLAARRVGGERADWIDFEDWTRHRRYVVAFLATIGVNVLYIFAVDRLGFLITGTIYLTVLFVVFGVGRKWVLPIAVIATLVIHYAFYKLLRVPLPWGLLQGMAY
jgi:putative tricarboxylic transport membrane protein